MNYIRIHIHAEPAEQEIFLSLLTDFDAVGFEQGDDFLLAYFPEENFKSYEVNDVLQGRQFEITTVVEKNWNEEWESNFHPVTVDDFVGLRAEFHPPFKLVEYDIVITPKMSFGTGHHATTYMMIREMRNFDFKGKNVLDFGTGTGVLAILAEKLGAANVMAIDNDEWSIRNAEENIRRNGCIRIGLSLTYHLPDQKFDIILANINRNVILQHMAELASILETGSIILFSGLLKADEQVITDAAKSSSLTKEKYGEKDNWISLVFSK
jgi:ribosomal protein L11 methyltransferase